MPYNILESRIEFDGTVLTRITVLVDCTSSASKPFTDVRAFFATHKPCQGYYFLMPKDALSNELLQKVAAQGMETIDRDEIFPKWRTRVKALTAIK